MNYIAKEKIMEVLDIDTIAHQYSPEISSKGKATFIICPFHKDKHLGSCFYYKNRETFSCKSCGAHGDALKLASGYTGIPVSDLNALLERLVEDFHLNRENYLDNAFVKTSYEPRSYLSDKEYEQLTGCRYIRKPIAFEEKVVDGIKQSVPVKYEFVYLRNLARRDPTEHDRIVCMLSRAKWRTMMKKIATYPFYETQCQSDKAKIENLLSKYHLQALASQIENTESFPAIAVIAKTPFDITAFLNAVIDENQKLLKRCLQNKQSYDDEIKLRETLLQREISVQQIVSMLSKG